MTPPPPSRDGRPQYPPARKSLGQHFLADPSILTRIVDAVGLQPHETVIEVGPGRGTMTAHLRERAALTIAIEYDRQLAELLRQRYVDDATVRIVEADVLQVDLGALANGPYALVGNVPYYITTPILFHALRRPRASRAVYLVQREVAERMSAASGSQEYGALSVNLQALARCETLFGVPAGAFRPPPKVESAVVRVTPLDRPLIAPEEEQSFRTFVQGAFGMRRKQMRRVLRALRPLDGDEAERALADVLIAPDVRPETVSPEGFAALLRRVGG